jgi:hypothetical protein
MSRLDRVHAFRRIPPKRTLGARFALGGSIQAEPGDIAAEARRLQNACSPQAPRLNPVLGDGKPREQRDAHRRGASNPATASNPAKVSSVAKAGSLPSQGDLARGLFASKEANHDSKDRACESVKSRAGI